MSNALLQVAELKRKYQLTYRITPEENGEFIVPDILDMTFVRFDRISIVTDFKRKHFGSTVRRDDTRNVVNRPFMGDSSWSQRQIGQDLVDAGFRQTGQFDIDDNTWPILTREQTLNNMLATWEQGRSFLCMNIEPPVNLPDTELYQHLFPNGRNIPQQNTFNDDRGYRAGFPLYELDINPPDILKIFAVDMIRPTTLWAGQDHYKLFDFAATTSRNAIIVRNEGKSVDDIPIRNDGLSMILRVRDLEKNYVLDRRQLGYNCIMELNISGGIL